MNHKGSNDNGLSERPEFTDNSQQSTSRSPISCLLYLLLQAHEYAREFDRDLWEFAVGMPDLKEAGICSSDIRWILCKGLATHLREFTSTGDVVRSFQEQKHLAVRKRSCFVLTNAGVDFIQKVDIQAVTKNGHGGSGEWAGPNYGLYLPDDRSMVPKWDCDRQELQLGTHVVKAFKLPSPNQSTILGTFEEEDWPTRIDDPLPPRADIEPKQRLHDAIKSLNRNQKRNLIRFRGDGTGQGVRWELRRPPFKEVRQRLTVNGAC